MNYNECQLPINLSFGDKFNCGWRLLKNYQHIEEGYFYLGIINDNEKSYNSWCYIDPNTKQLIKHRELSNGEFHLMEQLKNYHKHGFSFV